MADNPSDRFYTDDHEWAQADASELKIITIGVTAYAQEQLGDVVMVELPEVGDIVQLAQPMGSVESPKSVSDIFAPVSGEVVAINENLLDSPELINDDPYGEGWIVRIQTEDPASVEQLMDSSAYATYVSADGTDD